MTRHLGWEIAQLLMECGLAGDASRRFLELRTGRPFDPKALYEVTYTGKFIGTETEGLRIQRLSGDRDPRERDGPAPRS